MALKKVQILSLFVAAFILIFASSCARAHAEYADLFRRGNVDDIRAAIEAGADVNARDEEGIPVLTWCAQNNTAQAVELLLEAGADPHLCDLKGNTSFSLAAEHNPNPEVALRLLRGK